MVNFFFITMLFCFTFLLATYSSICFGQKADLIRLESFTPPEIVAFEGKIVVLDQLTLEFGQSGQTKTILVSETKVEGPTYNKKGEVISYGTLIAQQDTKYDRSSYDVAKTVYENAKLDLEQSEVNYKRNGKLYESNAISKKDFLTTKTDYLKAERTLQKSYHELSMSKVRYGANFIFAPFSGIITKVFQFPDVWYDKFKGVATVLSLNPVAIKIQIPLALCDDIDFIGKEPIIYSPGNDSVIENWIQQWNGIENGELTMYFMLTNKKISFYKNLPEEYKELPTFETKARVIYFDETSKTLAIPMESLRTDKNGNEYVWKIIPQEQSEANSNYKTYIAQKIPIKSNDKVKILSETKFLELQDHGKLKAYDCIIDALGSTELHDNQIILQDPQRWLYYPEEEIHAIFSLLPKKKGFYVPVDAITIDSNKNYFVTLENNKKIKVNIEGSFAGFKAISGEGMTREIRILARPNSIEYITKKIIESISCNPIETDSNKTIY